MGYQSLIRYMIWKSFPQLLIFSFLIALLIALKLILMKSNISILPFVVLLLVWYLRNHYLTWGREDLPLFSNTGFIVLALKFMSVISLGLIFVYKEEIQVHFFACDYLIVTVPVTEKAVPLPLNYFDRLVGNRLTLKVRVYCLDS